MSVKPCASTVDFIAFHAVHHPTRVAILLDGQRVTYHKLCRDISKTMTALEELGPQQGEVFAVETPIFYAHWLLVLALDALGVCSLSFEAGEIEYIEDTLSTVDRVLSAQNSVPSIASNWHHLDQSWWQRTFNGIPSAAVKARDMDPNSPLRLVKSSGTTGDIKAMIQSRGVHEVRIHRSQMHSSFGPATRYFLTMGFSVQAFHLEASVCLRAGGTCVYESRLTKLQALRRHKVTDASFLPRDLTRVLDGVPKSFNKRNQLRISTLGAPVSNSMRRRVTELLGARLVESYGTNETGVICRMKADGTGTAIPNVQVQTVNDDGNPVFGETGYVRVKSDGCVDGYVNDPDLTRKKFRDGWFYPGDVAIMQNPHTLRLLGRADDLINVGGLKVSPRKIEQDILSDLPVADAALAMIDDEQKNAQLYLAVVLNEGDDLDEITNRLREVLSKDFNSAKIVAVQSIPRTDTEKVQGYKLRQVIKRHLDGRP